LTGTRADLPTDDGPLDVYVHRPRARGSGPWPPVVVYMDAFGIRPELGEMAQRLADGGYVVAVPNLYHRTPFAPFDPVAVAAGGAERDRFRSMIASIDGAKVMRDTAAVLAHLSESSEVRPGSVAAVGYCMGGGYALLAAGTFPDAVAVAASFHGGSLATDRPDSPHLRVGAMRCTVYVGAGELDPTFPPEQRARLEEALTSAQVPYRVEVYPGARHGFAVTGHLAYDRESSERHWRTLFELLTERM
jgi:carboxymethylenebutenolidase